MLQEIKSRLYEARVLEICACAQFEPTPEKLRAMAQAYEDDPAVCVYAWLDCGEPQAIAVLKGLDNGLFEIESLAVHPERRYQGLASKLLKAIMAIEPIQGLIAETDDDAVGFYRKFGFAIEDLGMKYPGIRRYCCRYTA